MEQRLAQLPEDIRELVKSLPEAQALELLDKLLVTADLEYRPLCAASVAAIKARTSQSSQYGLLPSDLDFTWKELSQPSYVAIGAFDEARQGEEDVPVGFLVAQVSVLPLSGGQTGSGGCETDPATASAAAAAAQAPRRQRQRARKAAAAQPRLDADHASGLIRTGAVRGGALVLSVFFVGVDFEYRRQGIGQQLMDHARDIGDAAGAHLMWLSVADYNADALAFYATLGFQRASDALWRGQYGDNLLLTLVLEAGTAAAAADAAAAAAVAAAAATAAEPRPLTTTSGASKDAPPVRESSAMARNGEPLAEAEADGPAPSSTGSTAVPPPLAQTGTSRAAGVSSPGVAGVGGGGGFGGGGGGGSGSKRGKGRTRAAAGGAGGAVVELWGGAASVCRQVSGRPHTVRRAAGAAVHVPRAAGGLAGRLSSLRVSCRLASPAGRCCGVAVRGLV